MQQGLKQWNSGCNISFAGMMLALHASCFEIPASCRHQDVFVRPPKTPDRPASKYDNILMRCELLKADWRGKDEQAKIFDSIYASAF